MSACTIHVLGTASNVILPPKTSRWRSVSSISKWTMLGFVHHTKMILWRCAVNHVYQLLVRSFPFLGLSFLVFCVAVLIFFTLFADDFTNIRGVLYEVWDKYTRFNNSSILKFNEVFSGVPNLSGFSPSFSITAFSGASNYSLREKGYVSVRYWKVDEATKHRKLYSLKSLKYNL